MIQGFGLTENGFQSDGLLQADVTIISNEKCAEILSFNTSSDFLLNTQLKQMLKHGIVDQILCSTGIRDKKTGNYSVSIQQLTFSLELTFYH